MKRLRAVLGAGLILMAPAGARAFEGSLKRRQDSLVISARYLKQFIAD